MNFNKVVAGILEATGINEGTRTDAPVADWALGKTWLVGATVSANAYLWGNGPKKLSYTAVLPNGQSLPPKGHYPARYTVGLGVKPSSNKFCYACKDLRLNYTGDGKCAFADRTFFALGCKRHENFVSDPLGTDVDASMMPLNDVAGEVPHFSVAYQKPQLCRK